MEGTLRIRWETPPGVKIYTQADTDSVALEAHPSPAWGKYLLRHPEAWDGPLLRLIDADQVSLKLAQDRYSNFVRASTLGDDSQDVFVAVTGLVAVDSGFVIGLRSPLVTNPGIWEFAPAGGLQRIPIEEQLSRELTEELGLEAEMFHVSSPIGLFIDRGNHIADLVLPVSVTVGAATLFERFVPGEYSEIEVVTPSEVAKRMSRSDSSSELADFIVDLIIEKHS